MRKLSQIPQELKEKVNNAKEDKDLVELGFSCEGMLCENEGYENFFEHLWIWSKVENNEIYIIITVDNGNGYCSIAYVDMYVKKVINKFKDKNIISEKELVETALKYRNMLEKLQFVQNSGMIGGAIYKFCPICNEANINGHKKDCELAKLLE